MPLQINSVEDKELFNKWYEHNSLPMFKSFLTITYDNAMVGEVINLM